MKDCWSFKTKVMNVVLRSCDLYNVYVFLNYIQAMKDWILIIVILIVVTIDLLILLIGTSIPDSRLTTVDAIDIEHEITITVCM